VFATFDTSFTHNLYPGGIRFPGSGYSQIIFDNVHFWDAAPNSFQGPIGNATAGSNAGIVFSDFQINLNAWSGSGNPIPTIDGATNNITITFGMYANSEILTYIQNHSLSMTFRNTPNIINHGSSTALAWNTSGASNCTASGAWSGNVGTGGSRVLPLATAGTYAFGLSCTGASGSSSAATSVIAQ
jgi:hypothetical protein